MSTREMAHDELAEWAVALRTAGWSMKAIAAELEVSRSYASQLYTDPDRSKEKARKESYRRPCPGWRHECGTLMDGSWGRSPKGSQLCAECQTTKQHDTRYWTRDRIIEWLQAAADILGRNPTVTDLIITTSPSMLSRFSTARLDEAVAAHRALLAAGLRMLHPSDVQREFSEGSGHKPGDRPWDYALHAAGLGGGQVGGAPLHRSHLRIATDVAVPSARPSTRRVRGDFVCPSCGDFTGSLIERTGWCGACTREKAA